MSEPARRSTYRELLPDPSLRELVECYWFRTTPAVDGPGPSVRVLPDGCMDVLFVLGEPALRPAPRPSCYVVGPMRSALLVEGVGGEDTVGVRFRPGAGPTFLALPAHALTDDVAPLDGVWTESVELRERLLADSRSEARAGVLDAALGRRLPSAWSCRDRDVLCACRRMAEGEVTSVGQLLTGAGVGRRQLERRFRAAVGLAPGETLRVARLRRAVELLLGRPELGLARVALRAGYYDQPHLTRDFRELAGTPPGRYRRERSRPFSSDPTA